MKAEKIDLLQIYSLTRRCIMLKIGIEKIIKKYAFNFGFKQHRNVITAVVITKPKTNNFLLKNINLTSKYFQVNYQFK